MATENDTVLAYQLRGVEITVEGTTSDDPNEIARQFERVVRTVSAVMNALEADDIVPHHD